MQIMSYLVSGLPSSPPLGFPVGCWSPTFLSGVLKGSICKVWLYHLYIIVPFVAITSTTSEETHHLSLSYKFYYPEHNRLTVYSDEDKSI